MVADAVRKSDSLTRLLLNTDQFNSQHRYKMLHYAVRMQRCCWSVAEHHVAHIKLDEIYKVDLAILVFTDGAKTIFGWTVDHDIAGASWLVCLASSFSSGVLRDSLQQLLCSLFTTKRKLIG